MIVTAFSFLPLAIWACLLLGRGGFWRCRERDDTVDTHHVGDGPWPSIAAVVPARDEASVIGESVGSLLRQDYPGRFIVVIVDDQSSDGTVDTARAAALAAGAPERVRIITGTNLPRGWTGKIWAMRQGFAAVEAEREPPEFVLFTDADIAYAPQTLRRLVGIARSKRCAMTSLMVKLRCDSAAERWLVPAFVFFFQKLYPFAWVNDPKRATAAAAGGCMLVRREALASAGGFEALRNALIDDCALGALMKRQSAIWLGLTETVHSLRAYPSFADIRQMVARSAFAQLRYSVLLLIGTVGGMVVTYLAPPLLTLMAHGLARANGAISWALMALTFVPTLRLYGRPSVSAFALPAIAAAYTVFTLDSALQHWRGRGGYWKGRFQASMGGARDA